MTGVDIPAEMKALAERVFADGGMDELADAYYVLLCEAVREYLGKTYTGGDLWAAVQSLHENLEEGASDYSEAAFARTLPTRPTASIVSSLSKIKRRSSYASGKTPNVIAMAEQGVLKDGMLFYDIQKRRGGVTNLIRVNVLRGADGGFIKHVQWEHVSDDGTRIDGPFNSPSKASYTIRRGTVTNPFDTWLTEDGKTLRQMYMDMQGVQE